MESFFNTIAWIGLIVFGLQAIGRCAVSIWQSTTQAGRLDAVSDIVHGQRIGRIFPMVVGVAVCAAWIWR